MVIICDDLKYLIVKFIHPSLLINILRKCLFPLKKYGKNLEISKISSSDDLKYIKYINKIKFSNLDISENNNLKYLKYASDINLSLCHINDNDLIYFKSVNKLNLAFTKITDNCLKYIEKMKNLKIICFSFCPYISDNLIRQLKTKGLEVYYNPYTIRKIKLDK
jgi:penicillin-binding protein-related factor A (putative recombinase)